jgi:hypothetical protein
MRIARADRAFEETREAAEEIASIAADLDDRVRAKGALGPADGKSIDRLKKLAKKIRTDFGGEGAPRLDELPQSLTGLAQAIGDRARAIEAEIDTVTRYELNSKIVILTGDIMVLSDAMKARRTTR